MLKKLGGVVAAAIAALTLTVIAGQSPAVQAQTLGSKTIELTYRHQQVTFSVDEPRTVTNGWWYKLVDNTSDCLTGIDDYDGGLNSATSFSKAIFGNEGKYICIRHRIVSNNPNTAFITGHAGPITYPVQGLGGKTITLTYSNSKATFSVDEPRSGTNAWWYKLADDSSDCANTDDYDIGGFNTARTYSRTITGNEGKFICILHRVGANSANTNTLTHGFVGPITYPPDNSLPTVTTARISGATLTVTLSEDMSSAKAANSAWSVSVSGSSVSVNSYTLSGTTAVLTLASAVNPVQTVTLGYTKPAGSSSKLQDVNGNELATFSNRSVANNTPYPTVEAERSLNNIHITEGATETFTYVLTSQPYNNRTIAVSTSHADLKVSSDGSVPSQNLTLTFGPSNWSTPQTVTLSMEQDTDRDDITGQQVNFTLGSRVVHKSGSSNRLTVLMLDDDIDLVAPSAPVYLSEGGSATFNVKLSHQPDSNRTIRPRSSNSNVTLSPTTLTFTSGNWNTNQTVTVSAGQDSGTDDENATITLSGKGFMEGEVTARVVDDDRDAGFTPMTLDNISGSEGNVVASTIALARAPTAGATVTVALASDNSDLSFASDSAGSTAITSLSFTPSNWYIPQTFYTVLGFDSDNGNDTGTVTLTASGGGYSSVSTSYDVTVIDTGAPNVIPSVSPVVVDEDGSPVTLNFSLSENATCCGGSTNVGVRFDITSSDTSVFTVSPSDIIIGTGRWRDQQTLTVTPVNDTVLSGSVKNATINLRNRFNAGNYSNHTFTIPVQVRDDEVEAERSSNNIHIAEGSTETFTYVLASQPTGNRTIQVSTTHADLKVSSGGSTPAQNLTLTFTPSNWNTEQTVTLSMEQDADRDDITGQEVNFTLGDGLVHKSGSSHRLTVLMLDDDIEPVVPSTPVHVGEGGSSTFNVQLSHAPGNDRRVRLRLSNTHVTISPSTLTFTPDNWDTDQAVTVSAEQDGDTVDESTTITLSGKGLMDGSVTVTLIDDDRAQGFSPATLADVNGVEGDVVARRLVLTGPPTAGNTVTIALASNNRDVTFASDSAGNTAITLLSFTPGNWYVPQTFYTVLGADSGNDNDTATVTATASGGGYDGVSASYDVTIIDTTAPNVRPSFFPVELDEDDSATILGVRLTAPPVCCGTGGTTRVSHTFDISSSDTGVFTVSPSQLTFDSGSNEWNVEQALTITPVNDSVFTSLVKNATINFRVQSGGGQSNYAGRTLTVPVQITDDEIEAIEVERSSNNIHISEGSTETFTYVLSSPPTYDRTIEVRTSHADLKVSAGGSAPSRNLTLTFGPSNWSTPQTVTLSMEQDTDRDDITGQEVNFTLSRGLSHKSGNSYRLTVLMLDDDINPVAPSTFNVDEGSSATFNVQLSHQPDSSRTVRVTSASSKVSFSPTLLSFTSGNWNVNQSVTVNAAHDIDGADERAAISLVGKGLTVGSVTAMVSDDDEVGLTLPASSLNIDESGSGTFDVKLTRNPGQNVTVNLASDNADVTLSAATLTFTGGSTGNWNTAQTVTVSAAEDDDAVDDAAEISLMTSDNVTGSVSVSVADNDNPGLDISVTGLNVAESGSQTFTVSLATEPTANVTVTLAQPSNTDVTVDTDTAAANNQNTLTFTAANWDAAQTVTVSAADDADQLGDTATISLSAAGGGYGSATGSLTVSVIDDDDTTPRLTLSGASSAPNEGGTDRFTVRLGTLPNATVTVTLMQPSNTEVTVDTDTGASGNQNTLTFTASNWYAPQTVTVSAAHDDDAITDTTTISLSAAGGDYASVTASVSVTVTEDEMTGLMFSDSSPTVAEGGSATFTIELAAEPSASVTVTLVQPSNTDVTVGSTSLTFTTMNWDTPQTVTVSAVEDDDALNDTADIRLSAAGGGYANVTGSIMVTVTDNENADFAISETSLDVDENDSGTFTVRLTSQPSADVTVTLVQPGNTDVTVDTDTGANGNQNTLTFTTSNWDDTQTVTVNAGDDGDAADETAIISLTASGGDYGSVTGSLMVNVTDDDDESLILSPSTLSVTEGGSATFTYRLAAQPPGGARVRLHSSNTDVTIDRPALNFSSSNWSTPQTITLNAAEDADFVNDISTISLSAVGDGYDGVTASLAVTVTDNDFGLELSESSLTVDEGRSGTFTVRLSNAPLSDAIIDLASDNADVTVIPSSLTFTAGSNGNWNTPQTVTVGTVRDIDTVDDTAAISFTGSGTDAVTLSVTVTDDGRVGLDLSGDSLTIDENGQGSFTVKLLAAPAGTATVTLTSDKTYVTVDTDTGTTGNQNTLTFTSLNWEDTQTVTVTAGDDDNSVDDSATITLSGNHITTGSVSVTVTDDDKGVTVEEESDAAAVVLAEVASAMLPAASDAISLRFDAGRSARTATVAGRQITLDRSAARDLAAGFAERAGVRDSSQGRYAEDRFGAERHSGDWLGGIALDAGRPVRSGHERSSGMSDRSALLSGFSYALNADAKGGGSGWSVWGRFDTGEFSGTNDGVEFDSSRTSLWFGADRRSENGVLSGVAYSSSGTDADYTLGRYGAAIETDLTLVMPYAEREFGGGATGHAMLGIGSGKATITQTDKKEGKADLSMYMLAAGGSWPSAWDIGLGELSWSGDFGYSSLSTSGSDMPSLNGLSVSSMQLKGGMELAFADLGEAWKASPRAALLMRLDAGDGITGTGFELTGGMQMASASSDRFSLDINLRTLILHSAEELTDWGMSIQFRFNPRSDGGGLEFAAGPHWGAPENGGLLERDEAFRLDEADRQRRQARRQDRGLAGNIGYGLRALGGMLTPYTEYRFTSGSYGSTRQITGVRFSDDDTLELSLFSERQIAHRGEVQSRLAVELQKRF